MVSAVDRADDGWEVDVGWAVMTADGKRLGAVEGVHPQHLVVSMSRPPFTMLFMPTDAIADVESDRVYLGVVMADVLSQGWELTPEIDEVSSEAPTGTAAMSERMQSILGVVGLVVVAATALSVIVSLSIRLADAAVAVIFLLGVAAVGGWAYLVWRGMARR